MAPAEFVFGLFSGIMVFTMATTIIIDESRQKLAEPSSGVPQRLAVACALQFLGHLLGSSLATLLLSIYTGVDHAKSYTVAFAIATVLSGIGLLYTHFWVRETHFPVETGDDQLSFATHLRHYTKDAFGVLLKKREGWIRLCLFLCLSLVFIEYITYDSALLFLVLKQYNWADTEFSNLLLLRTFLGIPGTYLLPKLFSCLPWAGAESLMTMAAITASALSWGLQSVAHTVAEFFALSLFSIVTACISPGFRTILARLVPKEETGRLFALTTLVSIMCPMLAKGVLNNFFWATMGTWPGMVFLLVAAVNLVVLVEQMIVHYLILPLWETPKEEKTDLELESEKNSS